MAKKIRSGRMTYSLYLDIEQHRIAETIGNIADMNTSAMMRAVVKSGLKHYAEWLPPATAKIVKKKLGGK